MTAPARATTSQCVRSEARAVARTWPSRALLVVICLSAALAAARLGEAGPSATLDAELARLLRGMALLKASIVAAVLLAVAWRLAWPLSFRLATAYALSVAAMAAGCMLVWKLAFLATASVVFHLGLVTLGVASFVDGRRRLPSWRSR